MCCQTLHHEGNLTSKHSSTERYVYAYDHRNRLTKVTYSLDSGSGFVEQWHVDNSYDAFDRLVRRKDNLQQAQWPYFAGSDTVFTYQDGQVVLAFEVYGSITQRFLWGPQTDQLLATEYNPGYYGGGHIYFPLADAQGTIHDAAKFWYDSTAQTYQTTIVMHRKIDAYGRDLGYVTFAGSDYGIGSTTHSYSGPLFLYTGRYTDPLTTLQWNQNRWYAPDLGRWLTEDPSGFSAGDFNLARYVHNSPTNFTDPSELIDRMPGPAPVPETSSRDILKEGVVWYRDEDGYVLQRPASYLEYWGAFLDASLDNPFDIAPLGVVGKAAGATDDVVRAAARSRQAAKSLCEEAPTLGKALRKVPNPGGKLGGAAHRAKVAERAAELQKEEHTLKAGGGIEKERAVQTPNGLRFPDITTIDPQGRTYYEQIGRATGAGNPVAREIRTLDDIQAGTGIRPVFTPYNR